MLKPMAEGSFPRSLPLLHGSRLIAAYRLGFAALGIAAVMAPLAKQIERGSSLVNFFSFFTIQSNLIFIAVLLAGGWLVLQGREPRNWDLVRGGAAAYMTTTGVVYVLLLTGLEEDLETPMPWVNTVLHYWLPFVAVFDWIVDRPVRAIPFRRALAWLVFPLAWLAYTIVRGLAVGWYPYPFLDPDVESQGWGQVAVTCAVIFAAFTSLVWLMARTSGWGVSDARQSD